jgi:hypothetical protein
VKDYVHSQTAIPIADMQSRPSQPEAIDLTESDAYQALLARAQRRTAVGDPDDDGAEREIEAVVAAGDESGDAAGAALPGAEPMPSAADIQRLVSGLTVRRTAGGGLVREAPPETASTLAALFSGMVQLLQSAATPRVVGRPVRRLQRK